MIREVRGPGDKDFSGLPDYSEYDGVVELIGRSDYPLYKEAEQALGTVEVELLIDPEATAVNVKRGEGEKMQFGVEYIARADRFKYRPPDIFTREVWPGNVLVGLKQKPGESLVAFYTLVRNLSEQRDRPGFIRLITGALRRRPRA